MIAPNVPEIVFTLFISWCCLIIVRHTKCLYELSFHEGIHFFEQAFLAWGIGFFIRFLSSVLNAVPTLFSTFHDELDVILNLGFEASITLGGFFLVSSLLRKKLDTAKWCARKLRFGLIVIASVIAIIGNLLNSLHLLYIVQIVVLAYASVVAYRHWQLSSTKSIKNTFASLYLVSLTAALLGYVLNYTAYFLIPNFPMLQYISYILTSAIFMIVLYGVLRIVHSSAYCDRCCNCHNHGKKTRKA